VLDGHRYRGAGGGRNIWFAEGPRENGDRAARSGAVLAGAGGNLYSVGGEDRGGGARGDGIFARQGRGVGPGPPRAIPRRVKRGNAVGAAAPAGRRAARSRSTHMAIQSIVM